MHHPNYLAVLRRSVALTEQELASVVGYASKSAIYKFERGKRPPTLRFALACQVVFGKQPSEIFPAHFARIEELVLSRAIQLDEKVRHKPGAAAAKKRQLLADMVRRASKDDPS